MSASDVSAFFDKRPCNSKHSSLEVGSFGYFEEVREKRYFVERHIRPFANFPHWWGKRVLDIGCGIGTDTMEFALHGAKVTAVDLSERSLEITNERARIYRVEHKVKTVLGNMESLPPEIVGPYDLIWAWGSIHHTPNPRVALNEIHRLCAPQTTVKLMLYNAYSTKAFGLVLKHGADARRFSEAQENCPVTHWYSAAAAVEMVEKAGFVVSSCKTDFIFPYDVPAYRMHKYIRRFPWSVIRGRPFRWLERNLGWNILVSARPRAS